MSLNVNEAQLANLSSGSYLARTLNIEPRERRMMPGVPRYQDHWERQRQRLDCDEVYPGIIIGDANTVKNQKYLNRLEVTHILNMAEDDIHMGRERLGKIGITYKGFYVKDLPNENIQSHFENIANFIERAQTCYGSRLFVASHMGYSRSAAAVAAYLMLKKGFSANEALTLMRKSREVQPNRGFLHQLGRLDDELRKSKFKRLN